MLDPIIVQASNQSIVYSIYINVSATIDVFFVVLFRYIYCQNDLTVSIFSVRYFKTFTQLPFISATFTSAKVIL